MKKNQKFLVVLFSIAVICLFGQVAIAQTEEYTGNIISYNGPRTQTATFTLRIKGHTSDSQAQEFLSILQSSGQDSLLKAIEKEDLGSFSVNNQIAPDINVVRESSVNGQRRIFVGFERWMRFGELRYGTRSTDYPFGVIELYIDEKTGKGEGTFIAAARVRWDDNQVEIENFGTYPARLVNVKQIGGKP